MNITLPRAELQAALDALLHSQPHNITKLGWGKHHAAIDALRSRLAEPEYDAHACELNTIMDGTCSVCGKQVFEPEPEGVTDDQIEQAIVDANGYGRVCLLNEEVDPRRITDVAKSFARHLLASAQPASDDSKHLGNLLARIHRDGGHYQGQHGTEKAAADADLIVAGMYSSEDKPDYKDLYEKEKNSRAKETFYSVKKLTLKEPT